MHAAVGSAGFSCTPEQQWLGALPLPLAAGCRRPPCVVLDELDGAANGSEGHSAVAAIIKLITGGPAG